MFAFVLPLDSARSVGLPLRLLDRMRQVRLRDMGLVPSAYVGYAVVAGGSQHLGGETPGGSDCAREGLLLAATNVAVQEMRAAAANLFRRKTEARQFG